LSARIENACAPTSKKVRNLLVTFSLVLLFMSFVEESFFKQFLARSVRCFFAVNSPEDVL